MLRVNEWLRREVPGVGDRIVASVPDVLTRRSRYIPLSLRIFVALVVALGLASSCRGISVYRQWAAIREINRLAGHIETHARAPQLLRAFVGNDRMYSLDEAFLVNLQDTDATDSTLAYIGSLHDVEILFLNNTQITDHGLVHLRGLKRLRVLELDGTHVSGAGLAHLVALSRLERLTLGRTHVTDSGLVHLEQLLALRELGLSNTQVSDGGLIHIAPLSNLEAIWLQNTFVTYAGVVELSRILPGLTTISR